MEDILTRSWHNFLDRSGGFMSLRFVIQPCMSAIFGIVAGIKDAKEGKPAFFWSLLSEKTQRRTKLAELCADVQKVILMGSALDFLYQIIEFETIHLLELVFTVFVLAMLLYLIVRGPTNRMLSWNRKT